MFFYDIANVLAIFIVIFVSFRVGLIPLWLAFFLVLFALTTELLFLEGEAPEFLSAITLCFIALISLLKAYWLMIENPDGFILAAEDIEKNPQLDIIDDNKVDATDREWLNRLNTVMQEESYFKNNELTIRALSSHILVFL